MHNNKTAFLVTLVCGFSLLGACSSDETRVSQTSAEKEAKKHLTIGMAQYPGTLHRSFSGLSAARYVQSLMLREPTYYDSQAQLQCNACVNVPTLENGLARIVEGDGGERGIAVTFQIKPNLNWGDGSPVTSDDFKLRWQIGRHPDTGAVGASWFINIEQFEVVDDKTFTLHYKKANYEYSNIRRLPPINARLERPIFESDPGTYNNRSLYQTEPTNPALWNGPYLLKSITTGARFVVTRNPHWHGVRPQFDEIILKVVENTSALEANLLSGSVDMIGFGFQVDQGLSFERRHGKDYRAIYTDNSLLEMIDFNHDNPILADRRVRRALLYALNREQVNQQLFSGRVQPVMGVVPGVVAKRQYEFNPEKAAALLEQAGWKTLKNGIRHNDKGEPLQLELVSPSDNKSRELLKQWLQGQLKQVGVDLRLRSETPRVFFGQTKRKRLFTGLALGSTPAQPRWSYHLFLTSSEIPTPENNYKGGNKSGFSNAEMDRLTAIYAQTLTEADRSQTELVIQELMFEELSEMLLFWRPRVNVIPLGFTGFHTSNYSVFNTNWVEHWRWK